ncbi:MAG: ATP-grasp domain-containing protein [Muribaculaceae bacterium]
MPKLSILMHGGAKRVSIARMFLAEAKKKGLKLDLYSWELQPVVPIAEVAEIAVGRRCDDPLLLEDLHKFTIEKGIDIMIPFIDPAIGVVAKYRDLYGGIFAPLGSFESVEGMFDKVVAAEIFEKAGLPIPATYSLENHLFPLIAKPRFGSASQGILVINSEVQLAEIADKADGYLLQEYIARREEITVDCYVAADGEIIATVPRLRIAVIGGEVSRTITIDSPEIVELSRKTLAALNLRGAVTLQFIRDLDSGRILLMEINPRLGGGVVCSIHAGANMPRYILQEALGQKPEPCSNWLIDLEISRYQQEVTFHKGKLLR